MRNAVSILTILHTIYPATVHTELDVCVIKSHTSRRQINTGQPVHLLFNSNSQNMSIPLANVRSMQIISQ